MKTPAHQEQASNLPGCWGVLMVADFFIGYTWSRLCQGCDSKQGVGRVSAKWEGPADPRQAVISPANLLRLQHPQPWDKQ